MKSTVKKLSEATRKKIEAVEKLNDFLDAIDLICKQTERTEYMPNTVLVQINGEWVDVCDPKNKNKAEKYLSKDAVQHAEKLDQ